MSQLAHRLAEMRSACACAWTHADCKGVVQNVLLLRQANLDLPVLAAGAPVSNLVHRASWTFHQSAVLSAGVVPCFQHTSNPVATPTVLIFSRVTHGGVIECPTHTHTGSHTFDEHAPPLLRHDDVPRGQPKVCSPCSNTRGGWRQCAWRARLPAGPAQRLPVEVQ